MSEELKLNLTATLENDVVIPVTVTLEWPDGYGFTAVKSLVRLTNENELDLYEEMVNRGDEQTLRVLETFLGPEDTHEEEDV